MNVYKPKEAYVIKKEEAIFRRVKNEILDYGLDYNYFKFTLENIRKLELSPEDEKFIRLNWAESKNQLYFF